MGINRLHFSPGVLALSALAAAWLAPAQARPITFTDSAVVMAEYGVANTREIQMYYAPKHTWSFGGGHMEMKFEDADYAHEFTYARLNYLVKRWNGEASQANIFVWGGAGSAFIGSRTYQATRPGEPPSEHDHGGPTGPIEVSLRYPGFRKPAWNAGGQIDFETLRTYVSLKTDAHDSEVLTHRVDTLMLGFAPFKHDVDSLAAWIMISASQYTGNLHEGEELGLMLRLFRKNTWLEAGATTDGEFRAMAMVSF